MSDLEEKIASELVEQTVGALAAPAALPAQVIGEAIAGHLKGLRWIKQGRLKYKREDVEIDKLIAEEVLSLEEKIGTISQERFQTPELQVYGPAVNALSYTIEDENLREMFTNLLTKAMDSETINVALPAYTEIIKQLSSDEAKILNALADDINFSESRAGESRGFLGYRLQGGFPMWPLVQRLRRNEDSTAFSLEKDNVVDFNITLDKEDFLPVYVSNFEHLGIISIDYENPMR
ncbi:DUF4393 domain-containing protein [Deinococcus sp. SM5_A1]|uniref:DUF4393 domain-containing protein n=1 Tax=Deinococcus sp. SM5_A1 TaxID=3379094 RepID=UPI00385C1FD7